MTATTKRRATQRYTVRSEAAQAKKAAEREAELRRARRASLKARLRVVDPVAMRSRARRRLATFAVFGVVIVAMFAVAFVHAQLVRRQGELDDMREQVAQAEAEQARLTRDVVIASAPDSIVNRAMALGMVRAAEPVYLVAVRTAPATDTTP